MHAHRSHRHVQSLSSQTTTPHHSRDSTACAPLLTRAPLVSTPLHAISRIYTAVLNTHIHTHTHTLLQNLRAYTQSHFVNAQPSIFTTHICTGTQSTTPIFLRHPGTRTHTTLYSLPTIHTHTTTQNLCAHISTPSTYVHRHYICNSLCIYPPLHTHFRSTIYTPHIHTHTPHYTHAHKPTSAHTQALPLLILKC